MPRQTGVKERPREACRRRLGYLGSPGTPQDKECPGGGIGRHAVLRGQWRELCGFKSRSGHHSFFEIWFCLACHRFVRQRTRTACVVIRRIHAPLSMERAW